MEETSNTTSTGEFKPDAETLADAESLDYKHCTATDPVHKMQTTAGAISGVVGGAIIGTIVAGPAGAVVGAIAGGISGTIGGRIAGELFDPSGEPEYWLKHHAEQTFVKPGTQFTDYEPGYRTGYNNYTPGESFEQAEPDLIRYYNDHGGPAHLSWLEARPAAKAAWDRLTYVFPIEKMNRF